MPRVLGGWAFFYDRGTPVPEIRNPKPGKPLPKPETRNPEHATRREDTAFKQWVEFYGNVLNLTVNP